MIVDDLQAGQLAVRKIMADLSGITDDEVIRLIVEHALLHPFDTFCDYPLSDGGFPELTLNHVVALADAGFTVDIDATSARIFWVLTKED